MTIRFGILLLYVFFLYSCNKIEAPINHNIYHFTACSFVSTAVIFQVPGFQPKEAKETNITLRGEIKNNSRLLIRKGGQNNLSLALKKGGVDTTFSVQNQGEELSFYFLTDTPAGSPGLEKTSGSGISGELSYIQEAASDAIGIFEMIVRP